VEGGPSEISTKVESQLFLVLAGSLTSRRSDPMVGVEDPDHKDFNSQIGNRKS
jgi:hypothetical protein